MNCPSCNAAITKGTAQCCWFCNGYLCASCWEERGHCGHPEADAINQASRLLDADKRRELVIAAVGGERLDGEKAPDVN